MPKEIERKFLVDEDKFAEVFLSDTYEEVVQGYIPREKGELKATTVRVRTVKSATYEKGFITIKGKAQGISRDEYEYEIPLQDAKEMIEKFAEDIIEKTRYFYEYKGLTWEIDVFKGANEGLVLVEVELESENQIFEAPDFIGTEVTFDKRYYNAFLSKHPFWTAVFKSHK